MKKINYNLSQQTWNDIVTGKLKNTKKNKTWKQKKQQQNASQDNHK